MGFDNECILNLQSLPGEYFCPVCRTLIYPNEALQSQCTHLYCKPCLAYVVATTRACPYDGYLVTEADSKLLSESNKSLAETIGKVAVRCLYYRSGCQWQGGLSDCITHCTECTFGNSPVICNRCGTQIMHRQVQEHGQTCPGMLPQAQPVEGQAQDPKAQGQAVSQDQSSSALPAPVSAAVTTAASAATPTAATVAPASAPATATATSGQGQPQGSAVAYPQTTALSLTPEQLYQQQQLQYQQYYQQYPGYDPYQQHYQQYAQYQQQAHPQYAQHQMQVVPQQVIQGQQQPPPYMMPQPHPQHHPQLQPQLLPQAQPQPQLQPQSQPQPQPQPQPQLQLQPQPQPQPQPQSQPQVQPHPQTQAQPIPQPQPQVLATQPQTQQQLHPQPQPQPQPQLQTQPHPQMQAQPLHAPAQQTHPQAQPQTHPTPHAQLPGQQLLQSHPRPHHPQPQPHHQPPPQHQQSLQPQQYPLPQMQHSQSHPQQQPHLHPHPQPQQPHPHIQPQPHPMPQTQPIPQLQSQHPSSHAVTGHQSYPQSQLLQQIPTGTQQQRPMQVHPQQHQSQHPIQTQNQFPPQQTPQMRPPHAQLPMQAQQQPAMVPPQGPHANLRPAQQQVQYPVHPHGQQIPQHPGMQSHAQQQGLPQQAHIQLHPGQPQQQGTFPSQQAMHPQQHLRPQGPPYMQQQIPLQPHLQQNVTTILPNHQAQTVPSRPMMPNHGMPQQPFHHSPATPSMLAQASMNQQSPNQNHLAKVATQLPPSSDIQPGIVQQNQLTQPGVQGALASASPSLQLGIQSDKFLNSQGKGSESAELKVLKSENDLKSVGNEEASITEAKEKDVEPNKDCKDNLESAAQVHEKGLESHAKDENPEEPVFKPLVKEEINNSLDVGSENSAIPKAVAGYKGIQSQEGESSGKPGQTGEKMDPHLLPAGTGTAQPLLDSNEVAKGDLLVSVPDKNNQTFVSQGQVIESIAKNAQAPSQSLQQQNHHPDLHKTPMSHIPDHGGYPMQHSSYGQSPKMPNTSMGFQRPPAPDRTFPSHVPHPGSSQERKFPDPPQHQMQVHGQAMAPNQMGPPPLKFPETLPHQGQPSIKQEPFQPPMGKPPHLPYHSEMPRSGLPGPDLIPSSAMVLGPFALKNFEEQTMAPRGQNPNHMLPSHIGGTRNFQGEPLGRPVMGGPPPGPRGPPFGIEDQTGLSRSANSVEAEGYAAKRAGFNAWQHDPHHPGQTEHVPFGQPPVVQPNQMSMNGIPGKGAIGGVHDPGFLHGLPKERLRPVPEERFKPFHDEGFKVRHEEQFGPSAVDPGARIVNRRDFEEDLKRFPRPTHLDGDGVRTFDGYMPSSRPLDRVSQPFGPDAVPRPLDRFPYGSDGDPTLRPLSSYGNFPSNSGGLAVHPTDIGDRQRPIGAHEDSGRKQDINAAHPNRMDSLPPLRSPGGEFSGLRSGRFVSSTQSHMDDFGSREHRGFGDRLKAFNIPSDSVGKALHESKFPKTPTGLPGYLDGPGHMRMIEQGSGNLPGSLKKDVDGPEMLLRHLGPGDSLSHGFPSNLRSNEFNAGKLPSHLRAGESVGQGQLHVGEPTGFGGTGSHLRMGDPAGPGNLSSHLRIGDQMGVANLGGHMDIAEPGYGSRHALPNEKKHFNSVFPHGGMDSFEHSRMRKPGSMGWCRICKIDCETVEGLDLHSHTREHQKMAMDMVLSIKQESAKRQKLAIEGNMSLEDTNKIRMMSFESRMNRM